jgi:hypothetical protein
MWIYLVAWVAVFGCLGWYIAAQGERTWLEGFMLGALFGPLGCIVIAILTGPCELADDPDDGIEN